MEIVKMDRARAEEYLAWRYDPPYEFYNTPPHALEETLAEILCDNGIHYFSVLDESLLFGMYEYSFEGGAMEIGLGIRPQSTGQGKGRAFVESCIAFGRDKYAYRGKIVLRVADWNERAIYVYEQLGFVRIERISALSYGEPVVFIRMEREA